MPSADINRNTDGREPPRGRIEGWLASHRALVALGIVALSVLVRVSYFVDIHRGPLVWQHRWGDTDMHFYDLWARSLAAGNWLMDKPLDPEVGWHQHVRWHERIAEAYSKKFPEKAAALLDEAVHRSDGQAGDEASRKPSRVLWDHWYGLKHFHQGPLYPYLVALTYRIVSPDVRWVFAWQLVLGVVTNALIYLVGRRYFGDAVGALAGLLAVLSGPLLFYEMVLLRTTPITFSGILLVYVVSRAIDKRTWPWWLFVGVVFGLSFVLKTTVAIFGLGLLCLLAYQERRAPKALCHPLLAMAIGVAVCLAPAVGRNVYVGAPPLSLSSVGALAFVCANVEDYRPEHGFFVDSKHLPSILAKTDCRFSPAVVETLKTHPNVWSYIGQTWQKFASIWHWFEKPNNANFYFYRLHSATLRCLPVTFWVLAPLGIVGLFLGARRLLSVGPLYILVLSTLAPLTIFYMLSRFRVPLAVALIPFAALTLVRLTEWISTRQVARSLSLVIALLLVGLWSGRPLPADATLISPPFYIAQDEIYYQPAVDKAAAKATQTGDWQPVVDLISDSLEYEPRVVKEIDATRPPTNRDEATLAALFSKWRRLHGGALVELGHKEAGAAEYRRAEELGRAVAAWQKAN